MPQNAFKVSVTTAPAVLAEPIEGVITDALITNSSGSTAYVDFNNPLVSATDGYPVPSGGSLAVTLVIFFLFFLRPPCPQNRRMVGPRQCVPHL